MISLPTMEQLFVFNILEKSLLGITSGLFIVQIFYYLVVYSRPLRYAKKKGHDLPPTTQPPVSVIVYAKNESVNLQKHLPVLLTQNYPEYEVIVVNDGSTDESDEILKSFENQYPHLYHTYIPEDVKYLSRKKLALTVGIKAAKHDILLFTEANCQPLSQQWIACMAKKYTPQTDIILGFSAYGYHKGFIHQLAAYDNLLTGLQYLSSALKHHPFSGNGRNLSYRKELFFKQKGFYKSLNLHAGDDDLFINETANKQNTKAEFSKESITLMTPVERYKIWKEMKVSRAATRQHYKGKYLTFYRIEAVSFILFLISAIYSIIIGITGNVLVAVAGISFYLLLFLTHAIVLHKSSKMLEQKPTTAWLPILEFIQPLFSLYVRVYRIFRGKNDYTFRLGK